MTEGIFSRNFVIHLGILAIGITLLSGAVIMPASASISSGPQSHPPSVLSTLSAQWWRWILPIPPANNPLIHNDIPCNIAQSGPFFFLVGTQGGSAERNCTIPQGKSIFFPVINFFQTVDKEPPFNSIEKVKKSVIENINQAHNLHASVDGVNINLDKARALSPPFTIKLRSPNIFGAPPDDYWALSDGYWVALKPLSVGQHQISFSGEGVDFFGNPFSVDVKYHITVK
jgi:hypothetical protein